MYATLEREEFAMNVNLLIFLSFYGAWWKVICGRSTFLWNASLKCAYLGHIPSVWATKGTQDRDNSVCTK